ncbi:unnamed protein product [Protopolystoma xenopodis]|uniref:Uncharacterized protein n=1 Tax=Protopolystoma xenopodis TaxID=117903 RepID=A0A3S5CE10_9PLAT|nr:unnamed protein product [Protopolystoma xenopodis]
MSNLTMQQNEMPREITSAFDVNQPVSLSGPALMPFVTSPALQQPASIIASNNLPTKPSPSFSCNESRPRLITTSDMFIFHRNLPWPLLRVDNPSLASCPDLLHGPLGSFLIFLVDRFHSVPAPAYFTPGAVSQTFSSTYNVAISSELSEALIHIPVDIRHYLHASSPRLSPCILNKLWTSTSFRLLHLKWIISIFGHNALFL